MNKRKNAFSLIDKKLLLNLKGVIHSTLNKPLLIFFHASFKENY